MNEEIWVCRYTGVDTLDEPVTTTIVSTYSQLSLNDAMHMDDIELLAEIAGPRSSLHLLKTRSSAVPSKKPRSRSTQVRTLSLPLPADPIY